ncbi:3-hydroxyisobutyrate dehydrogenase [Georgenia satyanarayanai]|uniref:3-hydroxyisobutyrate dehydrogenase n=1 Tax=Georgenia satyanarayanai TaxID=860221 RepID=A0A2Y9AKZ7_9MICO|nr:NAD(P)-dependent oxidoreductase [Georgenia satyanarayanai]PYF98456.1 3-hydroxyisobutyrate dehydrogenase [Georgenia satyanarayanai]SSA45134.1 3-hydroxyisobutyrate dehydrogenase [Georgenia satyanarayanai]
MSGLDVAVLGLGAMGLPMAARLDEEHRVTGFDVSAERLRLAREAGVRPARSPGECVADADAVLVSVRHAGQLEDTLFGAGGAVGRLRPGCVVVLTSTVGADVVEAVTRRLEEHEVLLVDAPVSGGPVRAGAGDLLVVVGASDHALARSRPVLDALASSVVVVGPREGDGQRLKTVNQLLCGIHTAAAAEALALAHALGLDLDQTIDVLGRGAAASFMLADRGPRMAQQLHGTDPPLRSRLDVIAKDMGIVSRLAHELGVATPVAAAADQLYRLAEAAGMGAADDSVTTTLLSARGPEEGP